MNLSINRQITFNEKEFLDNLLIFVKSLVIKDKKEADDSETIVSIKKAREFLYSYNHFDTFDTYEYYEKDEFIGIGITDENKIKMYMNDYSLITAEIREKLLNYKRKNILREYEEYNPYYRRLNGLPPIEEESLTLNNGKKIIDLNNNELYIHKNEIKKIYENNPQAKYLNHLGDRRVPYYEARMAKAFTLLRYDNYILADEYQKIFVDLYYETVTYVLNVFYSKAFVEQKYYEKFMKTLIVFITIQRFLNEKFNIYIRRDFFDLQSLKDMFISHGLPFHDDIPVKFLKRIVKNLNQLLKYKGTNKVLVNILDIFDFGNAQIYKHVLLKDVKKDQNKNLIVDKEHPENMYELNFVRVPIETSNVVEYLNDDNLRESYDEVTRSDKFWGMTEGDSDALHEEIKKAAINSTHNYFYSKYISIASVSRMSQITLEISYFFNMLRRLHRENLINELKFFYKGIGMTQPIKLFDAFIGMSYLLYHRYGYDGIINYTPTSIGAFYDFNFNKGLKTLLKCLKKKDLNNFPIDTIDKSLIKALEDRDIKFHKNQVLDLYFNSRDFLFKLEEEMMKTNDVNHYKALATIYDFNAYSLSNQKLFSTNNEKIRIENETPIHLSDKRLFKLHHTNLYIHEPIVVKINGYEVPSNKYKIHDMNFTIYFDKKLTDEEISKLTVSYTYWEPYENYNNYDDYLKNSNTEFYNWLKDQTGNEDKIIKALNNIIFAIESYLNTDHFKYLFSALIMNTGKLIKEYLLFMLNLFKSYKVQFRDMHVFFLFDERFINTIKLLEEFIIYSKLGLSENLLLVEEIKKHILMRHDELDLKDIKELILFYIKLYFKDKFEDMKDEYDLKILFNINKDLNLVDYIEKVLVTKNHNQKLIFKELIRIISEFSFKDDLNLKENLELLTSKFLKDNILFDEDIITSKILEESKDLLNNLKELIHFVSHYNETMNIISEEIYDIKIKHNRYINNNNFDEFIVNKNCNLKSNVNMKELFKLEVIQQ